jgi:hypothetical protein
MIFRVKMSFQIDSTLPRDAMTLTPHFFGDDAQALADRLKTNLLANASVGATLPFTVKVYDEQKDPPNYPLATASNGTGMKASGVPREVALCLSYYSTYNRPTTRGRLYIPASFAGGALNLRPSQTQIDNVLAFKNVLTNGLPAGHNWVVYSKKMDQSYGVSQAWVDDEWDTVRSRGLKSTTRSQVAVP